MAGSTRAGSKGVCLVSVFMMNSLLTYFCIGSSAGEQLQMLNNWAEREGWDLRQCADDQDSANQQDDEKWAMRWHRARSDFETLFRGD